MFGDAIGGSMSGWLWWLLIFAGAFCVIVVAAVIERQKHGKD
jgi:hypothetical protein